jgi:hypothetical protein
MGNPRYASGRLSFAVCDRCGFRFNYTQIMTERQTNLRVCRACVDSPYPFWAFSRPVDAQSLRHPRPDVPMENAVPNLTDEEWEDLN